MGACIFILGLCLAGHGLASPLHAVFLPYQQYPLGYPWVFRENEPQVNPIVVELETQFKCTENGLFPDPESCHKFYSCNIMPTGQLQGFIMECNPGLEFHAENGRCDWPTSEECKHQGQVQSCADLEGESRTLCQERSTPEFAPVVIELETDLTCTESGIFADPNSCEKYYMCTDSLETFGYDCPLGLLFNADPEVMDCDWADSVDCAIQEKIPINVCSGPDLSEEQRSLCQSNAWKHTDHFRK